MIAQLQPVSEPRLAVEPTESVTSEVLAQRAEVKVWLSRIAKAKKKWQPDFNRMKANMEFVTGLQWAGQTRLDDDRYVNNLTLRLVSQKVASLYAKNPTAVAKRRERLDYQIWDGQIESLLQAIEQGSLFAQSGQPLPPELIALFNDYQMGNERNRLVDRLGKTLELVYQYQVDAHKPDYKEQFKQMVRRIIICGVGYVRPIFCSTETPYSSISTIETKSENQDRTKRIRELVQRIDDDAIDQDGAEYQTLRNLVNSIGQSQAFDQGKIKERLEFDFLPATSIIPDERCRNLKDFVAARFIAVEYVLPVQDVNAIFGVKIKIGTNEGEAYEYGRDDGRIAEQKDDSYCKEQVCVYEVFDKTSETTFFLCKGWKDYVQSPAKPELNISGFWSIFAGTFNDVEVEADTKASIFPPSDVDTIRSVQKEWNRTREALRDHRNANAPKYVSRAGLLTEEDKENLQNAVPHSVTELAGIPPEAEPRNFIQVMQMAPVDPSLYDTAPLEQDMMLGGGMQQANIGAAQPNVTATVGTIAEQSRLNVSASNVDDLDGVLSRLAQAGGEMLLLGMSEETVKRIAGPGAIWPTTPESRIDFVNEVNLKIEAASSGRPNKAIDLANWQQIAPLLQAAGVNPMGLVQESIRRLDDTMDLTQFLPLISPQGMSNPQGASPQSEDSTTSESGPSDANVQPQSPQVAANF